LALLLDVARYKYPPFWCDIDLLFGALKSPDTSTNKVFKYMNKFEKKNIIFLNNNSQEGLV